MKTKGRGEGGSKENGELCRNTKRFSQPELRHGEIGETNNGCARSLKIIGALHRESNFLLRRFGFKSFQPETEM